jgi:HSP20 family molecular chaperone IbpA
MAVTIKETGMPVNEMSVPVSCQEDIKLVVEGDMLLIRGQQNEEPQAVELFCRAIALPEGVEVKAIETSYKDGVLEVRMPRSVAKKVEVRMPQSVAKKVKVRSFPGLRLSL